MSRKTSRLRQELWRDYRALGRLLRTLCAPELLTPGSFYLMRRKCGKPNCRCARGQLHPAWVLTRSEAGRHKLYGVPASERARLRQRAAAYRRWQRARASFVKQTAALLARADQLAQAQTVPWPNRPARKPPR
jgi:uncharacterized protein DUF6788